MKVEINIPLATEKIINEKTRKQELSMKLESVDDEDLLMLIDELNKSQFECWNKLECVEFIFAKVIKNTNTYT